MDIMVNCPECDGHVVFRAARTRSKGRLMGRCESCGSVFSMFGGRLSLVESGTPSTPSTVRWRFSSLVDRERRVATEP